MHVDLPLRLMLIVNTELAMAFSAIFIVAWLASDQTR